MGPGNQYAGARPDQPHQMIRTDPTDPTDPVDITPGGCAPMAVTGPCAATRSPGYLRRSPWSFCDRFIDKRFAATHDQMVQAGAQRRKNIAEGSRAAATTSQTELRLVNVARASLEELLLDYEDYLRQRRPPPEGKRGPRKQRRCAHWARISLIGPIGPTRGALESLCPLAGARTIRRWWPTP